MFTLYFYTLYDLKILDSERISVASGIIAYFVCRENMPRHLQRQCNVIQIIDKQLTLQLLSGERLKVKSVLKRFLQIHMRNMWF